MNKKNTMSFFGMMALCGVTILLTGCTDGTAEKIQSTDGTSSVQSSQKTQDRTRTNEQKKGNMNGEGLQNKNMPTELIDACSEKIEGEACEVTRTTVEVTHTMMGTCTVDMRGGDVLICMSDDMKNGPRGGTKE